MNKALIVLAGIVAMVVSVACESSYPGGVAGPVTPPSMLDVAKASGVNIVGMDATLDKSKSSRPFSSYAGKITIVSLMLAEGDDNGDDEDEDDKAEVPSNKGCSLTGNTWK